MKMDIKRSPAERRASWLLIDGEKRVKDGANQQVVLVDLGYRDGVGAIPDGDHESGLLHGYVRQAGGVVELGDVLTVGGGLFHGHVGDGHIDGVEGGLNGLVEVVNGHVLV